MDRQDVFARVRKVIKDKLPDVDEDQITEASHLESDLSADSLARVEIMMGCEEEFDIEDIPDEAAEKLKTVGQIVDYIIVFFQKQQDQAA